MLLGAGETSLLKKAEGQRFPAFLHGRASAVSATDEGRIPKLFLLVLICSIFQFYIFPPVMGIYIPLYLVAVYALAFKVNWLEAGKTSIGILLICLYTVQVISWLWSPDLVLGVRDLIYTFPFLIVFLFVYQHMRTNPEGIWRAVRIFCVFAVAQSLLVISFRFFPDLEIRFFRTFFAKLFINPNVIAEFFSFGGGNNTFDAAKAGGFFVNANRAGAFAGILTYLTISTFKYTNKYLWFFTLCVHLLAILTCGSKASLFLLLFVPLLCIIIINRSKIFTISFVFSILLLPSLFIIQYLFDIDSLISAAHNTFMARTFLWEYAGQQFLRNPLLGQGYGGWNFSVMDVSGAAVGYDVRTKLPPHNALIILWSQSGIVAAFLGIVLWTLIIRNALTSIKVDTKLFWGLFAGYLIFIIHSLGENYGIFGDPHMTSALALIVGVSAYLHNSMKKKKEFLTL